MFSTIIRYHESGGLQIWGNKSIWSIGDEACYNHSSVPRFTDAPQTSKAAQAAYYKDNSKGWSDTGVPLALSYNHAGVLSLWFYLLSEGGQGVYNDAVTGLGIPTVEDILAGTLEKMRIDSTNTVYTFENFRDFTLSSVISLYSNCSSEHQSVVQAWKAVGLYDCDSFKVDMTYEQFGEPDTCKPWMIPVISNGSGCYSYQWYQKDVLGNWLPISTNDRFKAATCGFEYKVTVTDNLLSCSEGFELTVDTREVRKINDNFSFIIRPTLARDRIFLDLNMEEPMELRVSIFDQLGRRIDGFSIEDGNTGFNTIERDISNLSSGLYFITIDTPFKRYTKKFVKI